MSDCDEVGKPVSTRKGVTGTLNRANGDHWIHNIEATNQEYPLRENSCRPDMILNLGATRTKDGTIRRNIQEQVRFR
jgi:hypothetical protein